LKQLPDLAVRIVKAGHVYGRDPKDRTVRICVADLVGSLERDLGLADAAKAFDGGALTVILFSARGNSFEELF
jgi:hypothetical protein